MAPYTGRPDSVHVDDVVEGVYQRLCIRHQDTPAEDDRSMSLTELRLALGVTEALLNEALWLLTFPETSGSCTRLRVAWHWAPTGGGGVRGRRQPEVSRTAAPA